jgi:EAL domain
MESLRRLVPPTALGKARLAALLYAIAGIAPQLAQVSPDQPAARRAACFAALGLLLADVVTTYARRRTVPGEPLLIGAAQVAGGIGLRDPMAVLALLFCTLATQSLYGSHLWALVRMAVTMAALPVTIALAPVSLGRHISWASAPVLGLIPQVAAMGLLMRGLYASLTRQELAAARETLLARTGSRLLGRTDADAMFRLVISVGRILELETIVEGVETPAQEALLRRAGVQAAQGFRFARPLPAAVFPDWLAEVARAPRTLTTPT